jgi:hypothetical protein
MSAYIPEISTATLKSAVEVGRAAGYREIQILLEKHVAAK